MLYWLPCLKAVFLGGMGNDHSCWSASQRCGWDRQKGLYGPMKERKKREREKELQRQRDEGVCNCSAGLCPLFWTHTCRPGKTAKPSKLVGIVFDATLKHLISNF